MFLLGCMLVERECFLLSYLYLDFDPINETNIPKYVTKLIVLLKKYTSF